MTDLHAELLTLVTERAAARGGAFLIGIAGGVAVGKSTLARSLAQGLGQALPGAAVEVVATDGFLRPNRELEAAGLNLKKGFPETYDRTPSMRSWASSRSGIPQARPSIRT